MLRRERPKPLAFALVSIVDFGRVADDQIASRRQSSRVLIMGGSDGRERDFGPFEQSIHGFTDGPAFGLTRC